MEKQIAKMEATSAVSDDKLRPSLTTLVRATKDVTQAQDLLNLALDISAGTGKDLETVSLALAKAQTGNVGALTRLGVSLDAGAVASKDFDTIQRQLATSFKGASEAAAASSAGGMAQLSITVDNLYELVGSQLSPAVNDFATILNKVIPSATERATGDTNKYVDALGKLFLWVTPAGGLIRGLKSVAGLLHLVAGETEQLGNTTFYTTAEFRDMDALMSNRYEETLKKTAKELEALRKKQAEARKVAKEHADTLRDRVVTAVDAVGASLQSAKDQLQSFADSTADAITGFVSLADAFKTQTDAEKDVTDALKARKDAYADLAKAGSDNEAYAEALQKVVDAENNVTAAQENRASKNYSQVFQKQIADGKEFANLLGIMVGAGMSKAGLSQILSLGPSAGIQVAKDIINNIGGFGIEQLNTSLASLSTSAAGLGLTAGNAFFGGNVATGQTALEQAKTYQITVNAGLVSNPAQVGRDIIEAIKSAERLSGQVFVSV
jgi:hypothetical protein